MIGLDREQVRVEPHQTEWQECYQAEITRLSALIGDDSIRFEHVGSTAIKSLPAKPVIDILAVTDNSDTVASISNSVTRAGYEFRPDDKNRLFFAKGPADNRTHYLHVASEGSEYARGMLAFRDYLRRSPSIAAAYADLKQSLAEQFPEDRDSYTKAKSEFVEKVLDEALTKDDE